MCGLGVSHSGIQAIRQWLRWVCFSQGVGQEHKIADRRWPNLLSLSSELVRCHFYHIPLAKASCMTKPNISGAGRYIPPTEKTGKDKEGGTMVTK